MKHRNKGRYLNRDSSHRKLMFYNMSKEVIRHGIIKTTLPKAKELRRYLEPLITLSKVNNLSNRRMVFSKIREKDITYKLFNDIAIKYINRKGGYLSIIKNGYRVGDSAPMAIVKFVDN